MAVSLIFLDFPDNLNQIMYYLIFKFHFVIILVIMAIIMISQLIHFINDRTSHDSKMMVIHNHNFMKNL